MKNIKKIFIVSAVVGIISALSYGAFVYYHLQVWKYSGPDTEFTVNQGESFSRINYRLKKDGFISNASIFYRLAKIKGLITRIRVGTHQIPQDSNMVSIIYLLTIGPGSDLSVTIPEGKNLYEIAKLLESEKIIENAEEFINLAKNPQLTQALGIPGETVEGYLYPETYRFTKLSNAETVIRKMVNTFFTKVKTLDFKKSKLLPHEIITLASIVEKETGASFERPLIAGVFHNRLNKGMRLQSDPTTIYGIFENFNGNLRKIDLQTKTEYNTYRINGLPKGPISNPGLHSIQATLEPKKHSFFYFVSQNDGTHVFTKTYKEHLAAVKKWQLNRDNRSGRSWRDLKN